MKTFSELFSEAKGNSPADDLTPNKQSDSEGKGEETSSKKEKELKKKHKTEKKDHPESEENQFKGGTKTDNTVGPNRKIAGGERTPNKQGNSPKISNFMKKLNMKQSKTAANRNATKAQGVKEENLESPETLITEEVNVIDTLKKIVSSGSKQKITFKNGSSMSVDKKSASILMSVYEALKPANAKKFAANLGKGKSEFMKMLNFADSAS